MFLNLLHGVYIYILFIFNFMTNIWYELMKSAFTDEYIKQKMFIIWNC